MSLSEPAGLDGDGARWVSMTMSDSGRHIIGPSVEGDEQALAPDDMVPSLDMPSPQAAKLIDTPGDDAVEDHTWTSPAEDASASHSDAVDEASRHDQMVIDPDSQAHARMATNDVTSVTADAAATPSTQDDISVSVARDAARTATVETTTHTRDQLMFRASVTALRAHSLARHASASVLSQMDSVVSSHNPDANRSTDLSDYPSLAQREHAVQERHQG